MQTLFEAIDAFLEGSLDLVGNELVGRYKALKDAAMTGSWAVARVFEAVPQRNDRLATDAERQRAAALLSRHDRLRAAVRTVRGGVAAVSDDG